MDNRMHFYLLLAIDILAVIATAAQVNVASILATVLAGTTIVKGSPIQSFYTILATCLLAGVFRIGPIEVYFLLMLMAYLKIDGLLFQNDKLAPLVVLFLVIFIFHEIRYSSAGWIAYYLAYLLFLFKVLSVVDWYEYDHRYATTVFLISILFTQIGSALLTGDLSMLSDETNMNVRFGEGDVENGQNNNLGGAMGFPIYSVMFMTLSLPIILGRWARTSWKIILVILSTALFVVTFFTTSRVYLLGIGTFALLLLIMFFGRGYGFWVKCLMVAIIIAAIVALLGTGMSDLIQDRYEVRNTIDSGKTSSRFLIARDCLSYLADNPLSAIFGEGYISYPIIGQKLKMGFRMTAHNIVLDCVMAFGIFGTLLILGSSVNFFRRIRSYFYFSEESIMGFIPLTCWFVMSLTNSGFMYPKNYVIIPFLLLHAVCYYQLHESDDYEEL